MPLSRSAALIVAQLLSRGAIFATGHTPSGASGALPPDSASTNSKDYWDSYLQARGFSSSSFGSRQIAAKQPAIKDLFVNESKEDNDEDNDKDNGNDDGMRQLELALNRPPIVTSFVELNEPSDVSRGALKGYNQAENSFTKRRSLLRSHPEGRTTTSIYLPSKSPREAEHLSNASEHDDV